MKKFQIILLTLFTVNGTFAQWLPQNSGTANNLNSVHFTDDNTGYIVGDSGTILKTENGGDQWIPLNSGTSHHLRSVSFITPSTGYTVGFGVILRTADAGANWIDQTPLGLESIFFNGVHFPVEDTGYVVGTDWYGMYPHGLFLKSVDGGSSWSVDTIFSDTNSSFNAVFFLDANTGFVCGQQSYGEAGPGLILKTINGGLDWSEFTTVPAGFGTLYFTDAYNGFAGCHYPLSAAGGLYKTTDGGNTWAGEMLAFSPSSVFFPDAVTGFQVGWEGIHGYGAIRKTTDSGVNWTPPTVLTTNWLTSVYFTDVLTGYVVGDSGTILKTTNGGVVGLNESSITSKFLKLYPNPANDKINIESLMTGDRSLSIINVNSQKVIERQITNQKVQIDICDLPAGVYFVKLQNENTVEVRKIIKE